MGIFGSFLAFPLPRGRDTTGPLLGLVEEALDFPEPSLGEDLFGLLPDWAPGSDLLLVLLGRPEVLALDDRSKIPSLGFLPDDEDGMGPASFLAGKMVTSDS